MVKLKLVSLLVICLFFTSCTSSPTAPRVAVSKQIYEESDLNKKSNIKDSQSETGIKDTEGSKTVQPTPTPVPSVEQNTSQPEQRTLSGEKLDYGVLNSLSNKKLSWWITLNSEHKTPAIPTEARKLIEKYDGIYIGDTTKKIVYITFDEGYENGYTGKILDTLKADNVKSLFFVTGPYIKGQQALVKRMLDEGHQVGNHTINHYSLPGVNNTVLEQELYGLEKQFSQMYGKGFKYIRPPYGDYSERTLAAAKMLGYKTVFWSFAYRDFDVNNQKGPEYAHKMVMNNLHNGAVILLHAESKDNAEALDSIIKDIRAQGYEINPFDL